MTTTSQRINDSLKKDKEVDNSTLLEIITLGKMKDLGDIEAD